MQFKRYRLEVAALAFLLLIGTGLAVLWAVAAPEKARAKQDENRKRIERYLDVNYAKKGGRWTRVRPESPLMQ